MNALNVNRKLVSYDPDPVDDGLIKIMAAPEQVATPAIRPASIAEPKMQRDLFDQLYVRRRHWRSGFGHSQTRRDLGTL